MAVSPPCFTADPVTIDLDGATILRSLHAANNGLWHLHLSLPTSNGTSQHKPPTKRHHRQRRTTNTIANPIVPQTTIADRVAFYHATVFWPSLSTWCKAIDDNLLSTWPALTSAQVR
jgi:hypothetical protein